jgi:hypothetical protein
MYSIDRFKQTSLCNINETNSASSSNDWALAGYTHSTGFFNTFNSRSSRLPLSGSC